MPDSDAAPPDKKCEKKPINWWKNIIAGIITGILVAAVLIVTESVSLFWGVFLFVIPISAGIVVFSIDGELMPTFIFFMMLSSFAFAIAIAVMYTMLINSFSKTASLVAFYVIWLVITGLFFLIFKDKLNGNCNGKTKKE